jgi:hypothetical protein
MKNPTFELKETPPKLLPTLIKGFNTIANHWYLILFPIMMDLLLWLGPKISVKSLLTNIVSSMFDTLGTVNPAELTAAIEKYRQFWEQVLNQYNLATVLRTFPVGVPSLIARELPGASPLGNNMVFELHSYQWVVAVIGLLLLVGFLLGSLYFLLISRVTTQDNEKLNLKEVLNSYAQSLVMFCLLIFVLILISIPLFLLTSVLTVINLGIGQFFIVVVLLCALWLLVPLVFSPHGIFVLKQKALPSMLISVRLVRFFLPGTGIFVVTCLLINEGLNYLWTLPDANSWMTLLGIGGHSFIITGILAASFIYYREGLRWMQGNLQRMAEATKKQQENGGTTLEQ